MSDAISQIQTHMLDVTLEMIKSLRDIHQNEHFVATIAENGEARNYDHTQSKQRAESIIKKVYHTDMLISSLPQIYENEEEQLKEIQTLIEQNEQMNQKLKLKKIQAQKAQNRLTNRLKYMTNAIHGTKWMLFLTRIITLILSNNENYFKFFIYIDGSHIVQGLVQR